jgi:hypothetical protein
MTWTAEQRIVNRARAIRRKFMLLEWMLGKLMEERDGMFGSLTPLVRKQFEQLDKLNERVLRAAWMLKKLLAKELKR